MFSMKEKDDVKRVETILGVGTEFKGTINSKGSLRIDGKLEGGVISAEGIILGETSIVRGNINAKTVIICGKVIGNIHATSSIELLDKSQVHGDIRAGKIIISEGASFEGNCAMSTDKLGLPKLNGINEPSEPILGVVKETIASKAK